jgi:hypothetical protein
MGTRRPCVAMQIDLGPQCDALVESGTSIELNISLRVFSYRAHGEMRAGMIRPLSARPGYASTPLEGWGGCIVGPARLRRACGARHSEEHRRVASASKESPHSLSLNPPKAPANDRPGLAEATL